MSDFSAYFVHKWSEKYLAINCMIWREVSEYCNLLIDQPEPSSESDRPYYISRLEYLMRHADVMVGCVPGEDEELRINLGLHGDFALRNCSPYILFELRLAERLDLPRFILYDRKTGLRPPRGGSPHVRYVERNFDEMQDLLSSGKPDAALSHEIYSWIQWVIANRSPAPWTIPHRTAFLMGTGSKIGLDSDAVGNAFLETGFEKPESLARLFRTDSELLEVLRSIGLLVVDVASPEVQPLIYAAHALMVPTIRLSSVASIENHDELPLILRGHPAGYQNDLVAYGDADSDSKMVTRIGERAQAALRAPRPIVGKKEGEALLHRRTYLDEKHLVFISHDEKPGDRLLVETLIEQLRNRGVQIWEYALDNRAGEDWCERMESALSAASLMVALVSPRYEKSEGCRKEWNSALGRIPLLPFLTRGRSESIIASQSVPISHESRWDQLPISEQASRIAERVAEALRNPPPLFKVN